MFYSGGVLVAAVPYLAHKLLTIGLVIQCFFYYCITKVWGKLPGFVSGHKEMTEKWQWMFLKKRVRFPDFLSQNPYFHKIVRTI